MNVLTAVRENTEKRARREQLDRRRQQLEQLKAQIAAVEMEFQQLTDDLLIESQIYCLMSLRARYRFLYAELRRDTETAV